MSRYFYVENERYFKRSIIDENYKNFVFSRKILAKDLPIVTVSEANGYVTKGSMQLRHVALQDDEGFVAVGRDFNKRMVYYIFKCLKSENGSMKTEHFVCPAQFINVYWSPKATPGNWINSNKTEATGIQYPYVVPDDLCVYIFSKTPKAVTEKYGFQVLNENEQVVFDSRHKYLDIICVGVQTYSDEQYLINNKKIAIGAAYSGINYADVGYTAPSLLNSGGVIFEKGYTDPTGSTYSDMIIGAGARILDTNSTYRDTQKVFCWGSQFYVIDVTGF